VINEKKNESVLRLSFSGDKESPLMIISVEDTKNDGERK
jgi:hypothetical protein